MKRKKGTSTFAKTTMIFDFSTFLFHQNSVAWSQSESEIDATRATREKGSNVLTFFVSSEQVV